MRTKAGGAARTAAATVVFGARTAAPALVSIVALSACGANFEAQTNQIYQPADGANNKDSDVYVMGTLVAADGGHGVVVTRLINSTQEPDALVGVTATDDEGNEIAVKPLSKPLELEPAGALQLADGAQVGLEADELGGLVTLTFTFEKAQAVTLEAPVVPNTGDYVDVEIPGADSSAEPTEEASTE
ncbi:MAG: hypothetical protein H0V49_05175 [Nocardioidaceae bacterium]|nr:hypothetical protein [Nocardioidaceae bacterium]